MKKIDWLGFFLWSLLIVPMGAVVAKLIYNSYGIPLLALFVTADSVRLAWLLLNSRLKGNDSERSLREGNLLLHYFSVVTILSYVYIIFINGWSLGKEPTLNLVVLVLMTSFLSWFSITNLLYRRLKV